MIEFFFPNASPDTFQAIHFIIRKSAHFTVYGILSFLAIRSFRLSGLAWKSFMLALVVVLVVASLDELNQSFEPSRTSAISDVFLDLSGGAAVALIVFLFGRIRGKRIRCRCLLSGDHFQNTSNSRNFVSYFIVNSTEKEI
jgi:VanZ family protein